MTRMRVAILVLMLVHLPIVFAGFVSPYDPATQHRAYSYAPPSRVFLFGTDQFGRDQFSRWLSGGQISLAAGLLAAFIALGLGVAIGSIAGFAGGVTDTVLMRVAEIFSVLPWMYLVIAMRASLPLRVAPMVAFGLVVFTVGTAGWVRTARLVRGVVLTGRERTFVTAARGFGASERYLLVRHVLPAARRVMVTQAAMAVPQFIAAEVVLSFLGLGVPEPAASWGTLLVPLQRYQVLMSCWWMFIPAACSIAFFLFYYRFAEMVNSSMRPAAL